MNTGIIDGTIRAMTPLHHGSDESTGARSTVRRMKYQVDGKMMEIPVISGNSIRGVLRRIVMKDMLEQLDYKLTSLKTYHMLFAGGTLESVSSDSGNINLGMRKQMRDALPPLSLFGSAIGNQMIEGKMKCSYAIPICKELLPYLPALESQHPFISSYEQLTDEFTTRRDDLHGERSEGDNAHQMIVNFEVFAPGTEFYHKFVMMDCTDVEMSVLGRALTLWTERPYIGGKSSIGLGEIQITYPDIPSSIEYTKFISENKTDMIKSLNEIEGMLK